MMGDRYLLTEVQLGVLKALSMDNPKVIRLLDKIQDEQYICHSDFTPLNDIKRMQNGQFLRD